MISKQKLRLSRTGIRTTSDLIDISADEFPDWNEEKFYKEPTLGDSLR